jgi:histone deacetylase 11
MKKGKIKKAMIIDLDTHQGNGHENDKIDKIITDNPDDIFTIDMYQAGYPCDKKAMNGINLSKTYNIGCDDKTYLDDLQSLLKDEEAINFKPDILYYVAGTDIYENDPLSSLSITKNGIIKRDEMVFQFAFDNKIPICLVTAGGYSKESHDIISCSIENLFKCFNLGETRVFN